MVWICTEVVDNTRVKQRIARQSDLFLFEFTELDQNSSGILSDSHGLQLLDCELLSVTVLWVLFAARDFTLEES